MKLKSENHKPIFKIKLSQRRLFLQGLSLPALMVFLPANALAADNKKLITKLIPSTGEQLPVIGMGTWISFNVGNNTEARNNRSDILKTFFEMGGTMVDSSPMYGSAEDVMGYALERLKSQGAKSYDSVFSTTKVWTRSNGDEQIANSYRLWGVKQFDLFQIHNLLNWQEHLDTLQQLKADDKIRYLGITTSHGRRHKDLEQIMKTHDLDFVQLTYNIQNREVEQRLLPLAIEKGIAIIANRPLDGGNLFNQFETKPLPAWANEIGCQNWAQFFLKYVVSHPAITCAIPATTQLRHMKENMGAAYGILPDQKTRQKMLAYIQNI